MTLAMSMAMNRQDGPATDRLEDHAGGRQLSMVGVAHQAGGGAQITSRQREVLDVVLALMVEEGDAFSLAKVAKRASCSKETLYNWFGDRDGLLTATVRWQASKVEMPDMAPESLTLVEYCDGLEAFAARWLAVITSDVSAALNRLAIAHAASGKSRLGGIVLENGPREMIRRLTPIFELGRRSGYLAYDDCDIACRTFFGLVVADWQIRKLLGEATRPSQKGIEITAARAVEQFLTLYGAGTMLRSNHANTTTGE